MDLDPVHQRQVLVGGAAAYGEAAPEVFGGADAGERVQCAIDVVDAARHGEHLVRCDGGGRGALGARSLTPDLDGLTQDRLREQ